MVLCVRRVIYMKQKISWEDFVKNYSFQNDHAHVSAVICKGQINIDPILLCENSEIRNRTSRKFPGTGFDKTLLNENLAHVLAANIETELQALGFNKSQYANVIDFYKKEDERIFSDSGVFFEDEHLYLFKKTLVLGVLKKTGLLIEPDDEPFYIDRGENDKDDFDFSIYRLFFGIKSYQTAPNPKNNKKFEGLYRHSVKYLHANEYKNIYDAIKSGSKIKRSLSEKLTSTYRLPLVAYLEKR